jgi:hypothetical protein
VVADELSDGHFSCHPGLDPESMDCGSGPQ